MTDLPIEAVEEDLDIALATPITMPEAPDVPDHRAIAGFYHGGEPAAVQAFTMAIAQAGMALGLGDNYHTVEHPELDVIYVYVKLGEPQAKIEVVSLIPADLARLSPLRG